MNSKKIEADKAYMLFAVFSFLFLVAALILFNTAQVLSGPPFRPHVLIVPVFVMLSASVIALLSGCVRSITYGKYKLFLIFLFFTPAPLAFFALVTRFIKNVFNVVSD